MFVARSLSVAAATAGVTLLLEGCGSDESHPKEWDADCDKGCKPHVVCSETGAEVTVPKECTNQAFLDDLIGENETKCEDWIKNHSSDAAKKSQCVEAMKGKSANLETDCDDNCFVTFECNDKGTTLIPGKGCTTKRGSEHTPGTFDDCKKSFDALGDDWAKRTALCKKFRGDLPKYDDPASGAFHLPCGSGTKECQFTVVCEDAKGATSTKISNCPTDDYPSELFKDIATCKKTVSQMHTSKETRDEICNSLKKTTTTTTIAPATTHAPAIMHAPKDAVTISI